MRSEQTPSRKVACSTDSQYQDAFAEVGESNRDILVIEDDNELACQIAGALKAAGYAVAHAATLQQAKVLLEGATPRLLVLDRMLPDGQGLEFLATQRQQGLDAPTLVLSALGETKDRIRGLEVGADDYLAKPFDIQELVARVTALLRRTLRTNPADSTLTFDSIQLDFLEQRARRDGEDLGLQPREFKLLVYLARHAGDIVTRSMLLKEIWGLDFDPQTNVVEVHVSRLRAKLDRGHKKKLLHTVRGAGYQLII